MTNRKDKNYIGLRVSEEEHRAFEDKCKRTGLTGKSFLQKCIKGDEFRELAPKKASDVEHQLRCIEMNLMKLSYSKFNPALKEAHIYNERCDRFHKAFTDITLMMYLGYLWADD